MEGWGNSIGKQLIKAFKSLSRDLTIPTSEVYEKIDGYEARRLLKTRPHAKAAVQDFCECLRIIAGHGDTLDAIIAYADHLINSSGPIKMMTGHKSKGLEFRHVFLLDRHILNLAEGSGAKNQDRNLLYVMQTRAQEILTYIDSETFESDALPEEAA